MFETREEAGRLLGERIKDLIKREKPGLLDLVVLGIPRGGVVVAHEAAKILGCPLDVIIVKKIGAPQQQELAIGAMGKTKGSLYLDEGLVGEVGADGNYINNQQSTINNIIQERERIYRQGKPALDLRDKTVIIVDDGAATGATTISAVREVWQSEPKKVVIALPVVAKDTLVKLEKEADRVIYLDTPEMFWAVGQFYQNFPQVEDEEVVRILKYNLME